MDKKKEIISRSPVVTVLGHVDHGKTTLLDSIRKTNVQSREAGGITQGIGASVVTTKEGSHITFIDTPGHAAFNNMRKAGATIADIVILVVAADDGIKPQTKEALEYILQVGVPFIVALTKVDLPAANIESAKSQLEKEGVLFEGRGGEVPAVPVSGKTGEGIDNLLEMITLVAELHEISGSAEDSLHATVFETTKDKSGILVSVVIKAGTLSAGDTVVTTHAETKIRGIFDTKGKPVKKAVAGEAVQLLGFKEFPEVGSPVWHVGSPKPDLALGSKKEIEAVQTHDNDLLKIVIKAGNAGSLDAVLANLPEKVGVLASSVGDVSDSDIFFAKSVGALICVFDSKVPKNVKQLAQTEDITIKEFSIIYELFEFLKEKIEEGSITVLGKAEIVASFPFNNKKVAGSRIIQGEIDKKSPVILMRGEQEVGEAKILSIRKQKNEVDSVKQGEECGILLAPQLAFEPGDMILSVRKPK